MLSLTSWIRLIRNTTWLDPNRNNESIDHLRSNQRRSQDFFRGTHIFLLSSPSHHHHHHLKNPNIFNSLIEDEVIYVVSLTVFFCIWNDSCKILCRQIFFYHFLPLCFCAIRWRNGVLYFDYCEDRPSLLSARYFPAFSPHLLFLTRYTNEAFLCFRKIF